MGVAQPFRRTPGVISFTEEAPLAFWWTDAQGRATHVNTATLELLGRPVAEILGRTPPEFTHPEDVEIGLAAMQRLREGASEREQYEKRYLRPDGSIAWASVLLVPMTAGASFTGFMAMAQDITALKAAASARDTTQALLERVLRTTPLILFAFDRNGVITYARGRFGDGGVVGHKIWDIYADQDLVTHHFKRGLEGEAGVVNFQFGGRSYTCHYSPDRDPGGQVAGVTGVAMDISDQVALQSENAQMARFLASMSHELRTPLNSVLGFAQLLAARDFGSLNDRQQRYVDHIQRGGAQLLALINDILDLSKVRAGQMTIECEPLEAQTALAQAVEQMAPLAAARDLTLDTKAETIRFRSDGKRVHQVLLNLLSNAVKFTPPGGWIEITARAAAPGVVFEVRDSGCGIPQDRLDEIFDEYRQLNARGEAEAQGTGLGLALSRHLATAMEGSLTVVSEPGLGSTFSFALPLARAQEEVADAG